MAAELSTRYIELNSASLAQLKDAVAGPTAALAVRKLHVLCRDNDQQLPHGGSISSLPATEICNLVTLLAQALPNLENLEAVEFSHWDPNGEDSEDSEGIIDVSDTLSLILLAVQSSGRRPKIIKTFGGSEGSEQGMSISLCDWMRDLRLLFSGLEYFEIGGIGWNDTVQTNSFARGLNFMTSLTVLKLESDEKDPLLMQTLARRVHLPSLESFSMFCMTCQANDLVIFLRNHADTLTVCNLETVYFGDQNPVKAYQLLLEEIRDTLVLDKLKLDDLAVPNGGVAFPGLETTKVTEGGFFRVQHGEILVEGERQIHEVVNAMLYRIVAK